METPEDVESMHSLLHGRVCGFNRAIDTTDVFGFASARAPLNLDTHNVVCIRRQQLKWRHSTLNFLSLI